MKFFKKNDKKNQRKKNKQTKHYSNEICFLTRDALKTPFQFKKYTEK
jgi:hypothetical protein